MTTDDPRFGGIARLYGVDALARLQASHVVVVGIGGVGTWVAEALARTGIGRITLIDLDEVCVTNTNRQLPAMEGNIGRPKVEVMAERLRAINPACGVNPILDFLSPANMEDYLGEDVDCVVDCIDSIKAKVALIAWCRRRRIAVITRLPCPICQRPSTIRWQPKPARSCAAITTFPSPAASAVLACPASTRKSNCVTPSQTARSASKRLLSVKVCAWTALAVLVR